jgi:hypothetical protein
MTWDFYQYGEGPTRSRKAPSPLSPERPGHAPGRTMRKNTPDQGHLHHTGERPRPRAEIREALERKEAR